jgi:SAM-dependent methyltransferase
MGWFAQKIMNMGNGADSIDAVSQIVADSGAESSAKKTKPVVVEIGPGAGHAMRKILDLLAPSKVYGIEISEAFRQQLEADAEVGAAIKSGVVSLHGDDAKDLAFIPDDSVDLVFAFNVIYFLDPLDAYLKEFKRILKPGGAVNFGVKEIAKNMDPAVYKMTDWDKCLEEMKKGGFTNVEAKAERLEGPLAYTTLVGGKVK